MPATRDRGVYLELSGHPLGFRSIGVEWRRSKAGRVGVDDITEKAGECWLSKGQYNEEKDRGRRTSSVPPSQTPPRGVTPPSVNSRARRIRGVATTKSLRLCAAEAVVGEVLRSLRRAQGSERIVDGRMEEGEGQKRMEEGKKGTRF